MKLNTEKILKLIWLINGILLLGGIVIGGMALVVELAWGMMRQDHQGVEIIDTTEEETTIQEQMPSISGASNLKDYIYVPISGSSISRDRTGEMRSLKLGSYGMSGGPIINYLVIEKESQESYLLFSENLYIKESWCAEYEYQYLNKNYFLTVEKDTNDDGRLDTEDKASLWECEKSGKALRRIAEDVVRINIMDQENILIDLNAEDGSFLVYNSETGQSRVMRTEEKL